MTTPGRSLWAALNLLDRQVQDTNGVSCAKVDDLEFTASQEPDGLPILTSIICGQAGLAYRFSHRISRHLEHARRVMDPRVDPGPARISMGVVKRVATDIELTIDRRELPVSTWERWLSNHIVAHIPGSRVGEDPDRRS